MAGGGGATAGMVHHHPAVDGPRFGQGGGREIRRLEVRRHARLAADLGGEPQVVGAYQGIGGELQQRAIGLGRARIQHGIQAQPGVTRAVARHLGGGQLQRLDVGAAGQPTGSHAADPHPAERR